MIAQIEKWEQKNRLLVSKIELFYKKYGETNSAKFRENEFKAHKEMLVISGRIFKKEINKQVNSLWKLNQNFLAKAFN